MKLVYSFNIKKDNRIMNLCKVSKELYNQSLFEVKSNLKDNKFLFYNDLNRIMISKLKIKEELSNKEKILNLKIKNFEKQEKYFSEKIEQIRKQIINK